MFTSKPLQLFQVGSNKRMVIMKCKKCPHLVKHGQVSDTGDIEFKSMCGLAMKRQVFEVYGDPNKRPGRKGTKTKLAPVTPTEKEICIQAPFPEYFDYFECSTYQGTFKSTSRKNDVIPTKDFQYSDSLSGSSITEMELL